MAQDYERSRHIHGFVASLNAGITDPSFMTHGPSRVDRRQEQITILRKGRQRGERLLVPVQSCLEQVFRSRP